MSIHAWRGWGAVTLEAEGTSATFLPQLGMLGVSLRKDGDEYLDLRGGPKSYQQGHTIGMPLLHPWANRLSSTRYSVRDVPVDLGHIELPHDPNGLPIHGTMLGEHVWEASRLLTSGQGAMFTARFRYGRGSPRMYAAFPFPHEVIVEVTVDGRLSVRTTIRATGDRAVPVSFGWHPWFKIPRSRRDSLSVVLPARQHVALDDQMIPTGEAELEQADRIALRGGVTLDDHYVLGGRQLAVESGSRRVLMEVDEGYPYAQVFAPPDDAVVCLEPMTAVVDALGRDAYPLVEPGDRFDATFTVSIERH